MQEPADLRCSAHAHETLTPIGQPITAHNVLLHSVSRDCLACVQSLLDWAPRLALLSDAHGNTPLMLAIWNGYEACARALLPFSDWTACDEMGAGLLSLCCRTDNDALLQILLTRLNPHAVDKQNDDPLCWALGEKAHRCTRILVHHCDLRRLDAPPYHTPLHKAASHRNSEGLSILLQALLQHPAPSPKHGLSREDDIRLERASVGVVDSPAAVLGLPQSRVDLAFDAACLGHYWTCADLLTPYVSEAKLRMVMDEVGTHRFVQYQARMDRQALEAALHPKAFHTETLPPQAHALSTGATVAPSSTSSDTVFVRAKHRL